MTLGLILLVLLMVAGMLFVMPILNYRDGIDSVDRNVVNTQLYQRRLHELSQDEEQGVVADHGIMVQELQHNLLNDVPTLLKINDRPINLWGLLPGVILLIVISLGIYIKTGVFNQVLDWQRAVSEYPLLRERLMNEKAVPLNREEIARLGIGLRNELQQYPNDAANWMMLGRIGLLQDDLGTVTQAFAHAYMLKPNSLDIVLGYAEVLTRSNDAQDNKQARDILRDLLEKHQQDTRILALLAFNAFERGDYTQAIDAWQSVLKLLPKNSDQRAIIMRSILQAKAQKNSRETQLQVKVSLAPEIEQRVPANSVLIISVTDGKNPIPVAVKVLPMGHFPINVSLSDADAMMPAYLLSSLRRVKVKARIARDSLAKAKIGDWFGESDIVPYNKDRQILIQIDNQIP